MSNHRLSKEKRALVLAAICEGTPINAVTRMFSVGKHAVLRVVEESGEALGHYMHTKFRNLSTERIEMDEQWQYVGEHGQRMNDQKKKDNPNHGDFWLWAAIDPDSKLVISHLVARRNWEAGDQFVKDVSERVCDTVQITTDNHRSYAKSIMEHFGYFGANYGTETKIYGGPDDLKAWQSRRKNGAPRVVKATREVVFGSPCLKTVTTSHVERLFLSVRQELTRFTRSTLGYSKKLEFHRLAVSLHFGVYNLVRRHRGIANFTPAMAAGVESKRWSWEDVIDYTDAYWLPIYKAREVKKAAAKRADQDAEFMRALNEIDGLANGPIISTL